MGCGKSWRNTTSVYSPVAEGGLAKANPGVPTKARSRATPYGVTLPQAFTSLDAASSQMVAPERKINPCPIITKDLPSLTGMN